MEVPLSEETGKKRADFLKQGGILAIASLLVRIIGMVYRIPMSNILGEEGNGIYAVAFEIYDVMLIISSYSLPLALSKIISAQQARKQHKNTGKVFKVALKFAIISGGGFAILLFAGAGLIEKYIYPEYSGVQIPLRVLAPTIFIVALLGVFRGFFQGKKTMVPTAFSQIVEQIVNAVVSVAASYLFMKWNIESVQQAAWGAAGGTLGTCLGAASALLIVLFVYWLYKPVQEKLERRDPSTRTYSEKYLFKLLLITIIPIVLSQTVYNISGLIDYKIFGSVSGNLGMDAVTIKSFIGVYSSKYRLLCSVPIAISTALASSLIPSAVEAYAREDANQWNYNISAGIKFNMIIAIPCAVAFVFLGGPIVKMLFHSSNYVLGGHMLTAGSLAIVFYALYNITGGAFCHISCDPYRDRVCAAADNQYGCICTDRGKCYIPDRCVCPESEKDKRVCPKLQTGDYKDLFDAVSGFSVDGGEPGDRIWRHGTCDRIQYGPDTGCYSGRSVRILCRIFTVAGPVKG